MIEYIRNYASEIMTLESPFGVLGIFLERPQSEYFVAGRMQIDGMSSSTIEDIELLKGFVSRLVEACDTMNTFETL